MTFFLEKIAEEKILKALTEGAFKNLPGEGKPLPADSVPVAEDLRMAYRMLKTSNFLPPELELRKEINHTEALLSSVEGIQGKLKIIKRLNALIRKLNILQPTHPDREIQEYYLPKILEQMTNLSSDPQAAPYDEKNS